MTGESDTVTMERPSYFGDMSIGEVRQLLKSMANMLERDGVEIARLHAEVKRLAVERDQFMEAASVRDQRDADMQQIMRANNSLLTENMELFKALCDLTGDDYAPGEFMMALDRARAVVAKHE